MSEEDYKIWGRPFDLKILEAVRAAPFNVLHIHGKKVHFDAASDLPASVINWSHYATPPTLAEGRRRGGRAVMGGIDEATAAHLSPPEIVKQITNAAQEVGGRGLIVAPGCSVPTDTPVRALAAIKAAVERLA